MSLSNEEKAVNLMLTDPRFPTACVEGTFDGKRAVFICLVDHHDPKNPKKGYDITPLARLLEPEDLKHIRGHEDQPLGAAPKKIVLASNADKGEGE